MAPPVSFYEVTFRDYSKELSHCKVGLVTITAGNFAATMTNLATLLTALEGVSIGVAAKDAVIAKRDILSALAPSNQFAQRESKWLARYHDNTTSQIYRFEIPCADASLLATNSDSTP